MPCWCHFTISLSLAQLASRALRPPRPWKFEFRLHSHCLNGVRCSLWSHCDGVPTRFAKKLSVKMPAEAIVNMATKALAIAACTSSCPCSCFQSMLRNGHSPFASARCCECVLTSTSADSLRLVRELTLHMHWFVHGVETSCYFDSVHIRHTCPMLWSTVVSCLGSCQ